MLIIALIFVTSLIIMLTLSQRSLPLAIICGAIILCLSSQAPIYTLVSSAGILLDMDIILLALALAEIPIIGKILEHKLREFFEGMSSKYASMLGPALIGLLPLPGGALLSCPIVEKAMPSNDRPRLVATNIWFRHILFLVYPLSPALIIATKIAGICITSAMLAMLPIFGCSLIIGYILYVPKGTTESHPLQRSLGGILIIMLAPAIQIALRVLGFGIGASTFIAVSLALMIATLYQHIGLQDILRVSREMNVWEFSFILLAIVFYASVFSLTPIPRMIKCAELSVLVLCSVIPFLLGFATGRVQLVLAITIPIVLYSYVMSIGLFVAIYCSALAGYLISPAHPCLTLSSRYFRSSLAKGMLRLLPSSMSLAILGTLYGFFLLTSL